MGDQLVPQPIGQVVHAQDVAETVLPPPEDAVRLERIQAVRGIDHDVPAVSEHSQGVLDGLAIVPNVLDDLVEDKDVEGLLTEWERLPGRRDQARHRGLLQTVHCHVDPEHVGAELAEPFDVSSDPASHVEDPPIFQRDVPADEPEPPLLAGSPDVARLAQTGRVGRGRSLDALGYRHQSPRADPTGGSAHIAEERTRRLAPLITERSTNGPSRPLSNRPASVPPDTSRRSRPTSWWPRPA